MPQPAEQTRATASAGAAAVGQPICVRVDQAMRLLDIGKTKLYELLAAGDLEAIRIGRRTLVLRDSIDALVLRLRKKAPRRLI